MAPSSSDQRAAERIAEALHHAQFLPEAAAQEAAFHLTDWRADLAKLDELLNAPTLDAEQVQKSVVSFAAHASAHLTAAHRIVIGSPVTDVFELGAVKGSGRAKRKPGEAYRGDTHEPWPLP